MNDIDPVDLIEPAASRVRDPVTGRSIWLARIVQNPRVEDGRLKVDLVFTRAHARDDRKSIEEALAENLRGLGFQGEVVAYTKLVGPAPEQGAPAPQAQRPPKGRPPVAGMDAQAIAPHGGPIQKRAIPGVRHVVCVASGKGGVGKSTVAANLAIALQREGFEVGLMDADVYGPSVPKMMNASSRPMTNDKKQILPVRSYGVRCLSAGMLVPEEEAIIWRGPMIMSLLRDFLQKAAWGELDYLVIDLPPGTGDAQLTLIQAVPIAGAVIVTTPQDVALADAIRGITMFRKLDVPLLGLIENMAWYELPDGTRDHVFGEGGGRRLAEREGTELLGEIPLQTSIRRSGDQGLPAALGDDAIAQTFRNIGRRIAELLPVGA